MWVFLQRPGDYMWDDPFIMFNIKLVPGVIYMSQQGHGAWYVPMFIMHTFVWSM